MSEQVTAPDVVAMRVFLPASDYQTSFQFYVDLGFTANPLGDQLASMELGPFAFLLQDYHVEGFAGNFMMHLMVNDLDAWWARIAALDLGAKYGVRPPTAPAMQPWGLRVTYVVDPSGVLWHIAEKRKS